MLSFVFEIIFVKFSGEHTIDHKKHAVLMFLAVFAV